MDKFIFQRKPSFWGIVFTVLDDQGNEQFRIKAGWLGGVSIFEKKETEPCLTVRPQYGLSLFGKYIVRERTGAIIGKIVSKFTFRYPNRWEILNVQSGCVMFSICEKWSFISVKADIFLNEEAVGMLYGKSRGFLTMDLAQDPRKRIDRRLALAAAALLCSSDTGD